MLLCIGADGRSNSPRGKKMRFRKECGKGLAPAVLESLFPSSSAGMLQHGAIAQTAEWGFSGRRVRMETWIYVDCIDVLTVIWT